MSMAKFKQNAKAVAGLVAAVAAGAVGYFGPESPVGMALTLVAAVAGSVIVWASPKNTPTSDQGSSDAADYFPQGH